MVKIKHGYSRQILTNIFHRKKWSETSEKIVIAECLL